MTPNNGNVLMLECFNVLCFNIGTGFRCQSFNDESVNHPRCLVYFLQFKLDIKIDNKFEK
jgi:hypothetical protein